MNSTPEQDSDKEDETLDIIQSEPHLAEKLPESADVPTHDLLLEKKRKKLNQYSVLGLLIIVSFAIFPIVNLFFVPVVVAASFAALLYPLYTFFYKLFRQRKTIAAFVTSALLFLLLVIPIYIVLHLFVYQLIDAFHHAGPFIASLNDNLRSNSILHNLQTLPILSNYDLQSVDWNQLINESVKTVTATGSRILNRTSSGLIGFFLNVFILFFTMFYFFMDGKKIVRKIKFLLPIRDDYEDLIFSRFLLISRATIGGTIVIGLVQGILGALSLLVFGIKSWILWGFIMIVLSIIPMVGPWLVLIPAGIYQIVTGNIWQGICIIAFCIIVVSNIDNVLRPRLVGQGAKLHDLIIFFSSMGGIVVFGVMGFIVGPVIASLFVSVLDIYSEEFREQLNKTDQTRDQ